MTAREALELRLAKGEITEADFDRLAARLSPEPPAIPSAPAAAPEKPEAKSSFFSWSTMGGIAIIGVIAFVKLGGSKGSTSLEENRQLNSNKPSIVYTVQHSGGEIQVDINASGPIDFALLPTEADLTFPHGPHNYIAPFYGWASMGKSMKGSVAAGKYFFEVNADRHSKPVNFSIKVVQ